MSTDKDARIVELEQFINLIAPLGIIECAYCRKPTPIVEEGFDHICPDCETEGLKRKLAEQQAINEKIGSWLSAMLDDQNIRAEMKVDITAFFTDNGEELNNLLAKAKEEGRKEAVQVCAAMVDHILKDDGGTYGDAIRSLAAHKP